MTASGRTSTNALMLDCVGFWLEPFIVFFCGQVMGICVFFVLTNKFPRPTLLPPLDLLSCSPNKPKPIPKSGIHPLKLSGHHIKTVFKCAQMLSPSNELCYILKIPAFCVSLVYLFSISMDVNNLWGGGGAEPKSYPLFFGVFNLSCCLLNGSQS